MHESVAARWIGHAESVAADLSFDYFLMYIMGFFAAGIFMCWCVIIQFQLYQMCPGWGPIRKFDSDGTEEMRINQLLMHEEKTGAGHNMKGDKSKGDENVAFLTGMLSQAQGEMTGLVKKAQNATKQDIEQEVAENGGAPVYKPLDTNGLYTGFQKEYGSIGPCTWGYCEAPDQWGEERWDPMYGRVVVRHGFADTQWMRSHSRTWGRDEIQYQRDHGFAEHPPSLAEQSSSQIQHRMVIERGGY